MDVRHSRHPSVPKNAKAEGFGDNLDIRTIDGPARVPGIARQQPVCLKPLAGNLMQAKFIPLRYCPSEIEMELADSDGPIITNFFGLPDAAAATAHKSIA